jgi:hypothetical protein
LAIGTASSIASILAPVAVAVSGGLVAMGVAWLAVQAVTAIVAALRLRHLARTA